MVFNIGDYWAYGLCPFSRILKNTTFRKLDLFPSSDEGMWTPTNLTETDPVSETLCSLEYWTVNKVQKPSNLRWLMFVLQPFGD
jgi:hypothetical protein